MLYNLNRLSVALFIGGMVVAFGIRLYLNAESNTKSSGNDLLKSESEKSVPVPSDQKESKD